MDVKPFKWASKEDWNMLLGISEISAPQYSWEREGSWAISRRSRLALSAVGVAMLTTMGKQKSILTKGVL